MTATQHDAATFALNMAKVAEKCQLALQEFMARQTPEKTMDTPFDPLNMAKAFSEMYSNLLKDPARMTEMQWGLWNDYMQLLQSSAQRFIGNESTPVVQPDPKDRRFRDQAWQDNALFDFIKQAYLLSARWMQRTVNDVEGLDSHTLQKVDFYTRQFVDAMSPSNFIATNPEVLRATIESNGDNLVQGMQHMLDDLERGKGRLNISMTDQATFEVGKNLAVTKGKVIYQNDLMQLIQYAPATAKVFKTPLLMIPAWINKYYILDLQQENSFVKWLVERGYTVFVISWVNPDEKLAKKRFDDYLLEGPLAALDAIEQATGEKQVTAIGYCLGGTLLSIMLAYLKAKKQEKRINAAMYLTTMVDFEEAGELSVFIDEEQLRAVEEKMAVKGYLDGKDMAATFNMLRANDLIWSFVVNNYLLGKDPFPFDLLYWNADATRMPGLMHSFYLRNMYQKNLLVKPGGITLDKVAIDIARVTTPTYILSTKEDHIAPWKSTYRATQIYKGEVKFVLAASGHIAGVVNPPAKNKYGYWVGAASPKSADDWFKKAREIPGSWWPDFVAWHKPYAGGKVAARKVGGGKLKPLQDAPGSYVKVKS